MSVHARALALVASVVLGVVMLSAQPAQVSGTIVVGKTKIVPKSVAAVGYAAPNGRMVSVLVSDKPADRKSFLDLTKVGAGEPLVAGIFEGAWKSVHMEKALSGFVFTLNADRKIMSNEFLVGGKDNMFSLSDDDLVLELTSTAPRLTGRIRTKEPVMSVGTQQVGLDVTFDVPVTEPGK